MTPNNDSELTSTAPERIWLNESIAKLYGTVGSDHIPTVPYIRADLAGQETPQWSQLPPNEPGWYWFRNPLTRETWIGNVDRSKMETARRLYLKYKSGEASDAMFYAGPLPAPQAEAEEGE